MRSINDVTAVVLCNAAQVCVDVCVCVYMNVFQARWSVRVMTQINAANLNIASRVFFVSVISEGQVGRSQTLGGVIALTQTCENTVVHVPKPRPVTHATPSDPLLTPITPSSTPNKTLTPKTLTTCMYD